MNSRRLLRTTFGGMIASLALSMGAIPASGALLARWTFEESMPASAGPHSAEVGTGTAFVVHQGASLYSSPVGNGSEHSFSSTGWAVGDYYQFNYPLPEGRDILRFRFDMASNAVEPPVFSLQRSIDGNPYVTHLSNIKPSDAPPKIAWNSSMRQLSYSFVVSEFNFRVNSLSYRLLCYDMPFPLSPDVNVRLDNVSIEAVPEPGTGLLAAGAAVCVAAFRRRW